MKGGKPGYFPSFDLVPHPVPYSLYDPWGAMKGKTEEEKAKGRLVESAHRPSANAGRRRRAAPHRGRRVFFLSSVGRRSVADGLPRCSPRAVNNGRLAMIGLFGFIAEGQVPGSVPFLKGIIPFYDGDVMQPFVKSVFTYTGQTLV